MVTRPRIRAALALCVLASACELTDISLPPAQPVLVISSVLNTAKTEQFVVVEDSKSGTDGGVIFAGGFIPDFPPSSPVSDAVVTLTHTSPGPDCTQPTVVFEELPPYDDGVTDYGSGRYVTSDLCELRPNDVITLEVRAPDGRVVRGRTRIPGAQQIGVGVKQAPTGTPDTMALNRLNDSLWIDVEPIAARALQLEVLRTDLRQTERTTPRSDPAPGLVTVARGVFPHRTTTDTMSMMLPGSALVLNGNDGQPLFRAGLYHAATLAVTDTNYYDFTRSGSDDFTGRGFINHLEGGIGVFGSVSPVTSIVRVASDFLDSREGIYRMTGAIEGAPVDVTFEVYIDRSTEQLQSQPQIEQFYAFVEGVWQGQPILTTSEGWFGGHPFFPFGEFPLSASFLAGTAADTVRYFVGGYPAATGGYSVNVYNRTALFVTELAAVTLESPTP
jgi:hypothetical protein